MRKIDGKNNYEESKYMRKGASLSIPSSQSYFPWPAVVSGQHLCPPLDTGPTLDTGHVT
ncbi:hypothetical protein M501DRAFT_996402 [Patellaria atrata CBS 101060]|uniref:Uncharacterized protein n=1 Tax=Patellaria atrata CBS 101060 TaxID=1346257 RepID=A0A9P4S7M4_9PEZI|nr:hypothetical protein M501DRAFT_996402 [Patellaria atrata CBS 101060]